MLREVLKNQGKSFGKTYSEYHVYFDTTYLGVKRIYEDGTIIHIVKVKSCIIYEANFIISNYIQADVFNETIEFVTKEPFSWDFGKRLAQLIETEKKMARRAKEYTSLKCMKRYSYNGNGVIDCEMYAAAHSGLPCYIVNHFQRKVSACHGYFSSGKDVAKKLGYTFNEY